MSRITVFAVDGRSVGEFEALCNRGWQLAGHPGVSGGGSAKVTISADIAAQDWLQLGRVVLIEHAKLPAWAGVIDTPWTPTLPVQLTLYNIEYLLNLRVPETPLTLTQSVYDVLDSLLFAANIQEDTRIRMGANALAENPVVTEKVDQRKVWEQMSALAKKYGVEMVFEPRRDKDNALVVDLICATQAGIATGFELKEGVNARLTSASVEGDIRNSYFGAGKQSTAANRLATSARKDEDSVARYRLRSDLLQVEASDDDSLWRSVKTALDQNGRPRLKFTLQAEDVGDTYQNLRPGNSQVVHLPNLYLPGGIQGWRGPARVLAMALDEKSNVVSMTMEGVL